MNFPVSIQVLVEFCSENERDEWELPGGRLEPGEAPETCLVREFAEELVQWWRSPMLYEVLPKREAARWPVMPVVGFLHHASPDTYPYGWRAFRQGSSDPLTQIPRYKPA